MKLTIKLDDDLKNTLISFYDGNITYIGLDNGIKLLNAIKEAMIKESMIKDDRR